MKKSKWLSLLGGVSLALLIAGCGGDDNGATADGETIKLRAATGLSAQHAWWTDTMEPWMDRVEELTEGQVEFETFTGGELVATPDEGDAVLSGTIDVGLVLPIYQPDQFPMAEVTMLPLNFSDTLIASNAWKKLLESDVDLGGGQTYAEMQFADFKVFPTSTTMEYSISTTGHSFETVSDVEGTSLRTPSRIHEMYAEKIGVNSVTMPAVEIYDSLSRGTFEGAFYSVADWTGYGFQDLFTYTLQGINFGHFNAFIGMTDEKWDSLPENVQEAMTQANEELFEAGAQVWIDRGEEIIPENEANGGVFVDFDSLDQEVKDHFVTGIEDTWTDYAELLEGSGLPGNELVKLWRDILVEEGGEVPEAIMDLE